MSFLGVIKENNNYVNKGKIPFFVNNKRVGQIRKEYLQFFLLNKIFLFKDGVLSLTKELKTFEERTKALYGFAKEICSNDYFNCSFRDEKYPLMEKSYDTPLAFIDRSISPLLGSISFGQHLNAYVVTSKGMKMWIGRRASNKLYDAGKLDQLVAGGLPYDIPSYKNLIKECYEEAAISEDLLSEVKSVGIVSYKNEGMLGGKENIILCYDLELSEDFVPKCIDGEVEEFYLMDIEEVVENVLTPNKFKGNCNLVVIDFLVRHGYITPQNQDYIEIVRTLRS